MRKGYRSKSRLLKLPRPVLKQVNDMLLGVGEDRRTYQEIADWLKEQGYNTSKSAVDRYAKYLFALEKIKVVGEHAKSIIEEAGEDPLKIEEATAKLGAVVVLELFQEVMREDRIEPKRIGKLLGDFARLQMSSVAREKLKVDMRKKADRIARDAEKAAKDMSKEDLIAFIKGRMYGLR